MNNARGLTQLRIAVFGAIYSVCVGMKRHETHDVYQETLHRDDKEVIGAFRVGMAVVVIAVTMALIRRRTIVQKALDTTSNVTPDRMNKIDVKRASSSFDDTNPKLTHKDSVEVVGAAESLQHCYTCLTKAYQRLWSHSATLQQDFTNQLGVRIKVKEKEYKQQNGGHYRRNDLNITKDVQSTLKSMFTDRFKTEASVCNEYQRYVKALQSYEEAKLASKVAFVKQSEEFKIAKRMQDATSKLETILQENEKRSRLFKFIDEECERLCQQSNDQFDMILGTQISLVGFILIYKYYYLASGEIKLDVDEHINASVFAEKAASHLWHHSWTAWFVPSYTQTVIEKMEQAFRVVGRTLACVTLLLIQGAFHALGQDRSGLLALSLCVIWFAKVNLLQVCGLIGFCIISNRLAAKLREVSLLQQAEKQRELLLKQRDGHNSETEPSFLFWQLFVYAIVLFGSSGVATLVLIPD